MLRRLTAAAVVALSLLLPVVPAHASGADVIIDCNDNGRLTKEYSQREYRQALAQMPADVRQYTDCESIIRRAQLGLPGSTGGEAYNNDAFASATDLEVRNAVQDIKGAKKSGGATQRLGSDVVVTPGALSFTKVSAATSELPTPLLVLVALILLAVGAFAVHLVMAHRSERRSTPGI